MDLGHAKAAFINEYFAHKAFPGKFIARFDNTNPANGAVRDPVMYRFPNFAAKEDGQDAEPAPHHRTGWT